MAHEMAELNGFRANRNVMPSKNPLTPSSYMHSVCALSQVGLPKSSKALSYQEYFPCCIPSMSIDRWI